jgi:NADPH:quinone reductase-like Zn-dependent oxidoreductase
MAGGATAQLFQALLLGAWMSMTGGKKMGALTAKPDQKDLAFVGGLLEAGKVIPVIDRCYPLSETAEAIRYLEGKHARGKVVVTVAPNSQ